MSPGEGHVGLITYMRTDSTRIADEAQQAARQLIVGTYGAAYVPAAAKQYKKGGAAQDAHEAVRPTSVGSSARPSRQAADRGPGPACIN